MDDTGTPLHIMLFQLPFDYVLCMAGWLAALAVLPVALRMSFGRSRRSAKQPRPVPTWKKTAFSLWIFLVAMTAVELWFAIVYDQSDSFNMTNVSKHWFARHIEPIQKVLQFKDGQSTVYRDAREFPKQLPDDRHHICFVGDSFTFGHGVPNVADRFSDRVGAALERGSPGKFVVSNLADAGREIHWVEKLIEELVDDRLPVKTVVYVICLNDIEAFDDRRLELYDEVGSMAPRFFLVRDTYFLNLLYYRVQQARSARVGGYYTFLQDSYRSSAWDRMRSKLSDIHRLCAKHKIDLRIAVFPFLHNLGPDYPFADAHERIVAFCNEVGVPVLDLRPVLEPHDVEGLTVNRFDAHPNERAHALVAEALERSLLGDLQQP
jgi:GDSL-like Lipase/Acylhydrolase family